jgi:hypothetical protein
MVRKAKLKRPKRKAKKVAARTAKANVAQGGNTDVAEAAETDGIPERLQTMSAELRALTTHKIFPRNLTANAAYLVPGNPAVTRPEDAVANCFPGLEIDVRTFDRRFFPGLVFDFVKGGARLMYVDVYQDPDLRSDKPRAQKLYFDLSNDLGDTLGAGVWFIEYVEQRGRTIRLYGAKGEAMDDTNVWRVVRSLEADDVTIGLEQRIDDEGKKVRKRDREKAELEGWRRTFTDENGVISAAYQPGELMVGLCSPWQHDFRDCSCFYWAANHPDVVLGEAYPGESIADAVEESTVSNIPIDWLRSDRKALQAAQALGTIDENRPHQIDHFQINRIWQDLNIVLENREIGNLYVPQTPETANPFSSPQELVDKLRGVLAPLEIALTFEYLYARLSLISERQAQQAGEPVLGAVLLARERLLLVAASEMQHLRWVNQMLWDLHNNVLKLPGAFQPALTPATEIPTVAARPFDAALGSVSAPGNLSAEDRRDALRRAIVDFTATAGGGDPAGQADRRGMMLRDPHKLTGTRPAELRPLDKDTLDDFIAVEHPSAFIDGAYASVIATLSTGDYPTYMVELAWRIAGDGVLHEQRFREIRNALSLFFDLRDPHGNRPQLPYLRTGFREASLQEVARARGPLSIIKNNLRDAYVLAAQNQLAQSAVNITHARQAMNDLLQVAEDLADQRNIGVPFFKLWNDIQ